ncbi:MAG: hypothetical protein QOI07_958 [Verrucomicrobiota bacterium]
MSNRQKSLQVHVVASLLSAAGMGLLSPALTVVVQNSVPVARTLTSLSSDESTTVNLVIYDWIEVQEHRYRYLAIDDAEGIRIKFVIGEYLACEVAWAS